MRREEWRECAAREGAIPAGAHSREWTIAAILSPSHCPQRSGVSGNSSASEADHRNILWDVLSPCFDSGHHPRCDQITAGYDCGSPRLEQSGQVIPV